MDEFLESLLSSSSTWPEMSSDQVPGNANPILVENDFGSGGSSSSELSAFGFAVDSFVGSHSPLPSPLGHLRVENFFCNGEGVVDGKEGLLGKRPYPELEEMVARENLFLDHQDDMQGNVFLQSRIEGTQSPQQNIRVENSGQPFGGHSAVSQDQSGGARSRTRARRGQATDPHSIAERHRRERISERMKSLQLLVPNSNKTDKASMLDEIIDYVQFLQLQVKVLSMSRLGGAGAVSPLNVDVPHERAGGLVSTCLGQAGGSFPLSQEGLAFEQEFARLMESNMTTAMQYLQNKGLCLLPIALASAISSSSGKPLLPTMPGKTVDNSDRQKSDMQSMVSPLSGSSTDMVRGAVLSGTDASIKKSPNNKDSRQGATEDKLNVVEPLRYFDVAKVGSQREDLLRRGQ